MDTELPTTSTVCDCGVLPTIPVSYTALDDNSSAEDFGFDADGYVDVVPPASSRQGSAEAGASRERPTSIQAVTTKA
ncbi:MAG: hypothetical protein GWP91_11690 [Rhodobacterales bacterium]|nr:hypothetical protein [Rhodobacterales bacterium]